MMLGLLLILILAAACAPEATPFPVDVPPPATAASDSSPVLRYALAPNTAGFVTDLALLQTAAQVEALTEAVNPADLETRFDLIAAYGDIPGGLRSPVRHQVALIIRPFQPDNPLLVNLLRRSLSPPQIVSQLDIPGAEAFPREASPPTMLRAELANAGWPDGLSLHLGHLENTPGLQPVIGQLRAAGFEPILVALNNEQAQIALVVWKNEAERAEWANTVGEASVIDLFSLPISYLARPGLRVTFTPDGWPLPEQ